MNKINERQNKQSSIDKLAAQNQLYGDAKKRLGVYLLLSIPLMIILNIAVKPALLNDCLNLGWTFDLTDSIALFALMLAGYDLIYLKRHISALKQKAAKIQEDFDCTVYDLEWNTLLCGDKECELEIKKSSDKYSNKGKDRAKFSDWYTPEVENIDQIKAILVCQKENLGWDIEQRTKFIYFISIVSIMVFAISLIAGFYFEISLKSLILSAIIPSWPALSFAITNYFENKEAIQEKKLLKSAVDRVEDIKIPTIKYARNIQNLIFLNRKNNCLIFDWFYEYLRNANQTGISYASKQLIQRLL
ncbi:MAG: S-4TM family putative pore-forming effector [Candidatus Sedimenticola sp. (ex Thyasira tokunagai)]